MLSLRARLAVLWIMLLLASGTVAVMLLRLYEQSSSAQSWRTQAALGQICASIADRYGFYSAGWSGPAGSLNEDATFRRDLATIAADAIARSRTGDEPASLSAGVWQQNAGLLAGLVPPAAEAALAGVASDALAEDGLADTTIDLPTGSLVLHACPLPGPVAGLAGWAAARFETPPGATALQWGLGVLLAAVAGSTAWLTALIVTYNRRIATIEHGLALDAGVLRLDPTGMPDLDRIVAGLNASGERLREAHAREAALADKVAVGARLAALGRVAAGVAHEVRNPIAAMRLRVENALAGDASRRAQALEAVLAQIARLDALVDALLTMTSRRVPVLQSVQLPAWLEAIIADLNVDESGAPITVGSAAMTVRLDPDMMRLALNNLLRNARQHTPPTGTITLTAVATQRTLRLMVADTGPGVPTALQATLFEPFVTGRADGTGLGLAIAREMAEAHGGSLQLIESATGAWLQLDIPQPDELWRAS